MKWIKVATDIQRDPKVHAIADACAVRSSEALGLVVGVLTALPANAPEGDVSIISDTALEEWARWHGKRGKFAAAFRSVWCIDGVVASWDRWNGSAIRDAERSNERVRAWREQKNNGDETAMKRVTSSNVRGKKEKEKEKETTTTPYTLAVVDTTLPSSTAFSDASRWVSPDGHDALAALLEAVAEPTHWVGVLRGFAQGTAMDGGKPCAAERLALALNDFVAKGKHKEPTGASPKLFRAFVRSARTPEKVGANQRTDAEHKADELYTIRRQNMRRRGIGQDERPEPAWAAEIDAMFPDGRTRPMLGAA